MSTVTRSYTELFKYIKTQRGDWVRENPVVSSLHALDPSLFYVSLIAFVSEKAKRSLNVYYLATVEYNAQHHILDVYA